ncbi:MAG: DUF550 domain-containing protein [Klebsiella pneumoniae]|nr:DUF550 domain-containing protein [Klebsiella pneumoniae]
MTKSTITREQAQKIIVAADQVITALAGTNEDVHPDDSKKMCELWDDLNDRHAPPVVVRELARMALTAMDSEPVAYAWVSRSGKKHLTRCEPEQWRDAVIVTPLYPHAQPAPVITFYRDGIEAAAKWIDQQREAYDSKHVWSDPDTGTFEFGNDAQRDYSSTLEELAEGIRALHPNAGNSPVIPDDYAMVPMRLTAENGAKGALSGEFSETKFVNCPECFGDDECETCDGSGRIEITVPVTWTTIKAIWVKGVEHFATTAREND